MMTRKFHDLTLPLLGFGAMRLPLLADGSGHGWTRPKRVKWWTMPCRTA